MNAKSVPSSGGNALEDQDRVHDVETITPMVERTEGQSSESRGRYDAVVVGAGPNGLAAAITMAREGLAVCVIEASETVGGGLRTEELTLPGFLHDVASAVHPLAVASPFLGSLDLERYGLEWVHPEAPLAHPLDGGSSVSLERSMEETATGVGEDDSAYRSLMQPWVKGWPDLAAEVFSPPASVQRPLALARVAVSTLRSARGLAESRFDHPQARALFAGLAGHSVLPLERRMSCAVALVLAAAGHTGGWPFPRGGARGIADALVSLLKTLGGEVVTGRRVEDLGSLPRARAVLLDVAPRTLVAMAGERLPRRYRRWLERYRHGPGAFKLDWALNAPIPWRAPNCERAGTVHIGGSLEEIASAEREVWNDRHPSRPFILLVQPSRFDPTRAPKGRHTAWAYTHVPNGSDVDMTERIEAQIERFAPGFRDVVAARSVMAPADLEARNANLVGGDITGGIQDLWQTVARPAPTSVPYRTGIRGVYLCSASTPPGGGVHGMCGHQAARTALSDVFGVS
jgi:phytoene dehydrogenase-like protein